MNTLYKLNDKTSFRKKRPEPGLGMHPGGGFVAWPDGRTTEYSAAGREKVQVVCRGWRRRGYVAWPEKE